MSVADDLLEVSALVREQRIIARLLAAGRSLIGYEENAGFVSRSSAAARLGVSEEEIDALVARGVLEVRDRKVRPALVTMVGVRHQTVGD